jgi:cell division inhibitor SepF
MAFRDTWHRALVYFGLAEDHEYYDDEPPPATAEPEEQIGDRYRERPNVRRLSQRRRRDEIDDIFADDSPRSATRQTRVLRPVDNGRAGVQVHLVVPKNFNDAQQIADQFKDQVPVILNLQQTDTDLSKRLIDFASGLTYALDGGMQRIADKVFLLTPRNVEVSAEERARLIEKGFFNQS